MKKLIALAVVMAMLSGCAQRNPDGSHILDENGKEKISWPRTIAVVVGAPLLILGVAAMAKNSNKWGSAGAGAAAGGYGGYQYGQYNSPCQHFDDMASDGSVCGCRAATMRPGGNAPVFNYSDDKNFNYCRRRD